MRSIRKIEGVLTALAALTLTLGLPLGCSRRLTPPAPAGHDASPRRGGVFRYATIADLKSIDPAVAFDTESQPFMEMLFDGLVDFDEQGKIVPVLAERWEVADEGKTYRFFLRDGIKMHDGATLEAADVKRSSERALAKDTGCPTAQFFSRVVGFDELQAGSASQLAGVVVESARVVSYRLKEADPTFLSVMALPTLRPLCKSAGTHYDDEFQRHACGAGRFRIDAWEPGRFLRVRRFDGHHDVAHTYLDGVQVQFGVPSLTQRFLFEHRELDALDEFLRPDFLYFRTDPEWSRYGHERIDVATYGELLNTRIKPFDDVRVRRAVAIAVDRNALARYFEGTSKVTDHLLPPGVPGYDPNFPGQKSDLPRARALMAEAGYAYDPATGRGGYPDTITYYTGEGESALRYAQLIQYELSQIGLRLHLKIVSTAQYLTLIGRAGAVPMGFTGWQMDYPDPSDFFEPTFTTSAIAEEGTTNYAFYSNPTLDSLLERAHGELDAPKRADMYRQAERIVCDDAPWAFVYNPKRYELLQPWVHGNTHHPFFLHYFFRAWFDESRAVTTASLSPRDPSSALRTLGAFLSPRSPRPLPLHSPPSMPRAPRPPLLRKGRG